jgi:hypothetical protein
MIKHILLAILIQLLVRFISGSWISGTIAALAWILSRQIAQAEYRRIEQSGSGGEPICPRGRLDPLGLVPGSTGSLQRW